MPFLISDAVIWHESRDYVSLFHAESGKFNTLNETASKIWLMIASNSDWEIALSKLVEQYSDVDSVLRLAIVLDAKNFLRQMIEQGWIEER